MKRKKLILNRESVRVLTRLEEVAGGIQILPPTSFPGPAPTARTCWSECASCDSVAC